MLTETPDFSVMTSEALIVYSEKMKAQAESLATQAELAMEELARRTPEPGERVHGNFVVTASRARRFSAKLAKERLTPVQYAAICKDKPDPALARKVLGEDSAEYKNSCNLGDIQLKVREATEEDYEILLAKERISESAAA